VALRRDDRGGRPRGGRNRGAVSDVRWAGRRADAAGIGANDTTSFVSLANSDLIAGTEFAVDYEFKPRGRHEADTWSGDSTTEHPEEIPSITSTRGCQQAALRIVQETSTALTEVEIEFADIDPTQSLVAAINPDALPGDNYYETREIGFENGQGSGQFADRQSVGETVNEIRSQIDAVARQS